MPPVYVIVEHKICLTRCFAPPHENVSLVCKNRCGLDLVDKTRLDLIGRFTKAVPSARETQEDFSHSACHPDIKQPSFLFKLGSILEGSL